MWPARFQLSGLWLIASVITSAALVTAPQLPWWEEKHEPHERTQRLLLKSGKQIEQTVRWENSQLTHVVVWLDSPQDLPTDGHIVLTVQASDKRQASVLSWTDIPATGTTVFPLNPPLAVPAGAEGTLFIHLDEPNQQVRLKFQIDETKYPEGRLVQPVKRPGDLAFQMRYLRPALGTLTKQWGYALLLLLAGAWLTWRSLNRAPTSEILLHKEDILWATGLAVAVTIFYLALLMHPGSWLGPSDFSKDISYVTANHQALSTGTWPIWSHITCGGMLLLGNPEGNTFSLATLLSFAFTPEHALLITLAMEGGLAAAGTLLLARVLGLNSWGSLVAASIAALSPTYGYRIVEGFSMIGGAVAWTPWVFLGLAGALKNNKFGWILLSGLSLAAQLLRGDVHIIVVVILCVITNSP